MTTASFSEPAFAMVENQLDDAPQNARRAAE